MPNDLQEMKAAETPPREHGTVHSGIGTTRSRALPAEADLVAAAAILNTGEKVAILVGAGALDAGDALHAADEVLEAAELLGAGIAKALLGKAALPDDLPWVTGAIGLLGTQPSWEMMNGCDTLLMVGSNFPYAEFLPKEGKARGVQIDIDGRRLGLRYPMELNLVGDSKLTLAALVPHLEVKRDRAWRAKIEADVAKWWRVMDERALSAAEPINPQRVFRELSPRLPDGCILCGDSGSTAFWYARDLKIRRGMMASLSGGLASMGSALPYALAAKYAHPERPVIAIVGDAAMQMIGINALVTLARAWPRWQDPRLIVMVLNNGDLNMVSWEQRIESGDPKFPGSQDLPSFPYADYARLLGLEAIRVDRPDDLGDAWDAALAADRPTLLEMVTDPNVPPIPPHVTAKQTKAYLSALLKGDPDAIGIVVQTAKEWWAGR